MDEEKIMNLWCWFFANELRIRKSIDNNLREEQELIVQNLDNLILDMGRFSWDIGPGVDKAWSLTISPNGDKKLLEQTKAIIALAPELENWEFYHAKQAKSSDRMLALYDAKMDLQPVDTNCWHYAMLANKEGGYKLLIEATNIEHLDKETAHVAANLFVINEIGEEAKIRLINSIEIVKKFDKEYDSLKASIDKMKEFLLQNFK